jgi:hypothetical protein
VVSKRKRAVYRNLEQLEREKYIVYVDKGLRFTRKGLNEFRTICKEEDFYAAVRKQVRSSRIDFKRKIQAKLC